ncbi:hypothetical protein AXF42_Ash009406 [Apostasia shenzhenica]|uniref:Uncharacterized protein n=1 Tax=Apostasia shenzhenica TaxID=1088818 RepID=A0A2I0B400_9ASPA|nr:hypothetical protein AXF42_Ash009406 [Apostasia shenzhenica]
MATSCCSLTFFLPAPGELRPHRKCPSITSQKGSFPPDSCRPLFFATRELQLHLEQRYSVRKSSVDFPLVLVSMLYGISSFINNELRVPCVPWHGQPNPFLSELLSHQLGEREPVFWDGELPDSKNRLDHLQSCSTLQHD